MLGTKENFFFIFFLTFSLKKKFLISLLNFLIFFFLNVWFACACEADGSVLVARDHKLNFLEPVFQTPW